MLAKFIYSPREDSLTAAVFSHLLHLPSEMFWQILRSACHGNSLPPLAGELQLVQAWPQWSAAGLGGRERVVPDLFLRFADFDLIIEAKIHEARTQHRQQWQFELAAYVNEYGHEKRAVRMIALGGIHSHHDDQLTCSWQSSRCGASGKSPQPFTFECPVTMCQWSTVLLECQRQKRRLELAEEPNSRTRADRRIFEDLAALFERHGYRTLRWLDDLDGAAWRLDERWSEDLNVFRLASRHFQPP